MLLPEGTIGRVVQHQKWSYCVYTIIQDTHNIGMNKTSNSTRFRAKPLHIITGQLCSQNFDRRLGVKIDMFAQIDLCESPLALKADEPVIAKPSLYRIRHLRLSGTRRHLLREPV